MYHYTSKHRSIYRSIVFHVSSPRYYRYSESPPLPISSEYTRVPLTDPPLSLFITSSIRAWIYHPPAGRWGFHRFRKFYAKPVPISLDIRGITEWDRMHARKTRERGNGTRSKGVGGEDLRASFSPSPCVCIETYEYSRITVASVSRRVKRSETIDRFTADSLLSLSLLPLVPALTSTGRGE